jgi:hypothetical protein
MGMSIALLLVLAINGPYGYLFPSVDAFQLAIVPVGLVATFFLYWYAQRHLNDVWAGEVAETT